MYYSYIPKYGDLDYLFEKYIRHDPSKRLNFFFDVKNGIYNKDVITEDNKLEHSVEFIAALVNVIEYIKRRLNSLGDMNGRLKFYFFCETGKSSYHRGIDMNYKGNRDINDYLMRSKEDELFSQATHFSIYTLKEIINLIPNAYFFLGEFREFDYIPYVVYKKCFTGDDIGIIFSTDKDMYQMNSYTNCFEQLEKLTYKSEWHPGRLFVNRDNYIDRLLYKDIKSIPNIDKEFVDKNFSLIRAIVGDCGDGVIGIKGLGYITLFKLIEKFKLQDVILERSFYNELLKKIDFFKFDFERENSIFDLNKIKEMGKEIKTSKKLSDLFNPNSIKKICKNLALMDYDIMFGRRSKDNEVINPILENTNKFQNMKEVQSMIFGTGLWNKDSYFKIQISI